MNKFRCTSCNTWYEPSIDVDGSGKMINVTFCESCLLDCQVKTLAKLEKDGLERLWKKYIDGEIEK
jgi:transcription elongation factor Elf1